MKNKLLKLFVLGSVIISFLFVLFFGFNVNAEETPESTETPTQEVVEQVDEEDKKINEVVEFIQTLNKDELLGMLDTVKNWFIAVGITGGVTLLAAIIGLIAAIVKLKNEKIRNSQLTEDEKQKRIEDNNKTQDTIVKECENIKLLLLDFMNGLEDKDKEQVVSNISNVKARLLELEKNNSEE